MPDAAVIASRLYLPPAAAYRYAPYPARFVAANSAFSVFRFAKRRTPLCCRSSSPKVLRLSGSPLNHWTRFAILVPKGKAFRRGQSTLGAKVASLAIRVAILPRLRRTLFAVSPTGRAHRLRPPYSKNQRRNTSSVFALRQSHLPLEGKASGRIESPPLRAAFMRSGAPKSAAFRFLISLPKKLNCFPCNLEYNVIIYNCYPNVK